MTFQVSPFYLNIVYFDCMKVGFSYKIGQVENHLYLTAFPGKKFVSGQAVPRYV